MADTAELDPLNEVNTYTGETPNQQLAPTVGAPQPSPDAAYTKVGSKEDYDALPHGAKYVDPEGNVRNKQAYVVTDEASYHDVPEKGTYVDPEGNQRTKPAYEPLNYTAQTLHSMAINPKEQRKALEYSYPGMVEEQPDGSLLVNDNGVLRAPGAGRGIKPFLGAVTAGAAPTVGAGLGALGGAAATAATGPGAVFGTAAGGAGGAIAGQMVNDAIFGLIAGSDRTSGEEATNLALAGLTGSAGAGVGRGVAAFVPSIKAGASAAGAAVPGAARNLLGATKEGLERSEGLAQRGYAVPPSAYAPDAPHLQNMVEVLDPAFRTNKPLVKQNRAAYEKEASGILKEADVPEFQDSVDGMVKPPSLTNPTEAIPTARVGEALRAKVMTDAQAADDNLKALFEQRRQQTAAGLPEQTSQREAILKAQDESRRAVDTLINENYARINQGVDRAYALSRTGANTGEAWAQTAEELQQTRRALGERATQMYNESHELGGNTPIVSEPLSQAARDFAGQLPEEFRATQPAVVRRLQAMAGEIGEDGEVIRPPTNPTFAELHQLRSIMRTNADFSRLNSDVRNGTFKHFNNVIDDVIHDTGAQPHLQLAAQSLDRADAFYREQMPIFNAKQLQAVMRGVEAGEPANPIALYKTLVDANQPDMTARIRQMVGPNLWSAVQAAHVDDLMRRSMSTSVRGAVDGPSFARNVLADHNSGLLGQVQDRATTDQLLKQADAIAMSRGKMDIPVQPGDRMLDVLAKARAADAEAKQLGSADPLKAIEQAGRRIASEEKRALGQARSQRSAEPLGFLFDAKVGTQEAADRILAKPDLLLAASDKFGPTSTEFKLLQQAYLWKILKGDMDPGKELAKIAPEIQHLMFPGKTLPQLQALAKDMDFLADTKLMRGAEGNAGSSMMATAKVEHPPLGSVRGVVKRVPGLGIVSEFAARSALSKFYAFVASKTAQNPATFSYLLRGLRGTPEQRQMSKEAINQVLRRGSTVGAGAGEGAYQAQ